MRLGIFFSLKMIAKKKNRNDDIQNNYSIMALEIERKFIVKSDEWRKLGTPQLYKQGYIPRQNDVTVRVRIAGEKAFMTLKGKAVGFTRSEFEYEIPLEDAHFMLENYCLKPFVEKYRTKIKSGNLTWEVDEFTGDNKGLVMAEIELPSEDTSFDIPNWIGQEVTGDSKYNNSYLVANPYNTWK